MTPYSASGRDSVIFGGGKDTMVGNINSGSSGALVYRGETNLTHARLDLVVDRESALGDAKSESYRPPISATLTVTADLESNGGNVVVAIHHPAEGRGCIPDPTRTLDRRLDEA
jgi:hypothetical protein